MLVTSAFCFWCWSCTMYMHDVTVGFILQLGTKLLKFSCQDWSSKITLAYCSLTNTRCFDVYEWTLIPVTLADILTFDIHKCIIDEISLRYLCMNTNLFYMWEQLEYDVLVINTCSFQWENVQKNPDWTKIQVTNVSCSHVQRNRNTCICHCATTDFFISTV